jgi:[ribosomal protein S5]-alanine N-acetyltransferase
LGALSRRPLRTDRLLLRPTRAADAGRAFAIQSDWEVARMLSMARFPPDRREIGQWFAGHSGEWAGEAYRFAVEHEGAMIGVADVDEIGERQGSLGYWFDRSIWGRGYASEAADAVVRFARAEAGLVKLVAGHADDNPASGRVLCKLGFRRVDVVPLLFRARRETIMQHRYVLAFNES